MKKVLCMLIAAVLMSTLMIIPVNAYSNNMFDYVVNYDNTIRITSYHGSYTNVTVPSQLNTDSGACPVTAIGKRAFENCTHVKSVTLPDTVTTIGEGAFWGCSNLTNITVPDSVTEIGQSSFYETNLQNLREDDSFVYIGKVAYRYKGNLNDEEIRFSDGTLGIAGGIFYVSRYSGPRTVYIPDSVRTIGDWAFRGCGVLTDVQMGSGVEKLGSQAFGFCSSLRSLTLPFSVVDIRYGAFDECPSLTLFSKSENVHDYALIYEIPFVKLPEQYLLGDADGNGEVDICDAVIIQRLAAMIRSENGIEEAADIDHDDDITVCDATLLQCFLADIPTVDGIASRRISVGGTDPDAPYMTVDFGRFTADVPKNWVYERSENGFFFFEAYNHDHPETGSDGYLCEILSVMPEDSYMVLPFAHYLGGDDYYSTYIQYPTGMGIIEDKTGSQKMQTALKQTGDFEASVIVK